MRRDYFNVEIRVPDRDGAGASEPDRPVLAIGFDGPASALDDRLARSDDRADRSPAPVDVTYRLHGTIDDPETEGVLAVSDRLTGDFLLEANVAASEVREFIRAARALDTEGAHRYQVSVPTDSGSNSYNKSTLLVYTTDGDLLRRHSLIPSGVEL